MKFPEINWSEFFSDLFNLIKPKNKEIIAYIAHITEYDKDGIPNYTWIHNRNDCPNWALSMFDRVFGKGKNKV